MLCCSQIYPKLLEIGIAISAMLDSQPSLGRGRASHPNYMINRTTPGELLEIINQFILLKKLLLYLLILIGYKPGFRLDYINYS